jgi:hypothetical protein
MGKNNARNHPAARLAWWLQSAKRHMSVWGVGYKFLDQAQKWNLPPRKVA